MKKLTIILLVLMVLFGCQKNIPFDSKVGINEINYEELNELMNSQTQFLLYIGRSDCGDCIEFYPILEEYMNEHSDTGIYYINIKEMRDAARKEDASEEEKQFYENFYTNFKVSWTPTIEWIRAGKIYKTYQYLDEDYIAIEDRAEQKKKRQEFLDEFNDFMDSYREASYEKMS